MWELDYKENWVSKNLCFWTVVLEKTLESLVDSKEIQPVYPKGNQSWIFIGKTDAEVETPILWPPDGKNGLIWKDPDAGKDWGQEEKGMTEDEMVGWYHWLNGHEFEWAMGVGDGQGNLVCCNPWGRKESDTTERLNWKLYYRMGLEPLNTASKKLVFHKYLNKVVGACSLDEIHGSWTYSGKSCWAAKEALRWRESVCHLKDTRPRKFSSGKKWHSCR